MGFDCGKLKDHKDLKIEAFDFDWELPKFVLN